MKNKKFNFDGKNFEIYNETENYIMYVELKKNGQRRSPNRATLGSMDKLTFKRGKQLGGITLIK